MLGLNPPSISTPVGKRKHLPAVGLEQSPTWLMFCLSASSETRITKASVWNIRKIRGVS